jgi:hypothetical protein
MTRDMVEREYTSHLRASNDADGMVEAGVVDGALDLYAQRGEWDRVFEVAGKDSGESLSRYAPAYITASLEKGRAADVVAMFTRYGAPCIPAQYALLQRLVAALLAGSFGATVPESVLLDARELMYRMTALAKRCVCAASRGVAVPTAATLGATAIVAAAWRCRCRCRRATLSLLFLCVIGCAAVIAAASAHSFPFAVVIAAASANPLPFAAVIAAASAHPLLLLGVCSSTTASPAHLTELERLLLILHYASLRSVAR